MEHIVDIENDTVVVTKWRDTELNEHDADSEYVENYWLSILAPTSTWLIRRLSHILEENPGGCSISVRDLSIKLGMGHLVRRKSPLVSAFDRLAYFDLLRPSRFGSIEVRSKLPSLSIKQLQRLTPAMQAKHSATQNESSKPSLNDMRTRAFALAVSMLNAGEDRDAIESRLMDWKFHPTICFEATERAFSGGRNKRVS